MALFTLAKSHGNARSAINSKPMAEKESSVFVIPSMDSLFDHDNQLVQVVSVYDSAKVDSVATQFSTRKRWWLFFARSSGLLCPSP